MDKNKWLADKFEENRGRMRGVAYRMLGSLNEADDAVQEAWIRLSRSDENNIENLGGWLTTVVSRVCLDMLRSRKSRGEEPIGEQIGVPVSSSGPSSDPEQEALLADSVGLALLVVLGRLAPAERVAFVLHDMFAVPFEEIGPIVGRTPAAARQLASRARRRVQGAPTAPGGNIAEQLRVANAFLAALRAGDIEGLISVLDPDVVVHVDEAAARPGAPREVHGAQNWARGAVAFAAMARSVQPALINGSVGFVWAPQGRLKRALTFTLKGGRIAEVEIIGDPVRLGGLNLAVRDSSGAIPDSEC